MRRLWRLLAPAVVSLLLTLALLVWFGGAIDDVEGGLGGALLGLGLHVLALQVAVSVLVVVAIDDLTRGAGWASRRSSGRQHGWFEIATCPISLPVALARFYSRPLLPVLLLSLGCGLPLAAVVLGALGDQGYEVHDLFGLRVSQSWSVAFPLLVLAALLLLRAGTVRAALGLVWGLSLSFGLGEYLFSDYYYGYATGSGAADEVPNPWPLDALVLSAVVLLLRGVRRLRARAATGAGPVRATASVARQ